MKRIGLLFLLAVVFWGFPVQAQRLLILAGAAVRPPLEEAARAYEKESGTKVDLVFGGSGYVLSQMILSRRGDLYFPGSSDYMERAKAQGVVFPETERRVAYLVPAIIVPKGNPKGIKGLKDLLRPGIRVAIANPEGVCVGAYAVEIIEHAFSEAEKKEFRARLVNYTRSCAATAMAVMLGNVDAVLGWRVFAFWAPDKLEVVPLKKEEIVRIGYLPVAVARFASQPKEAQRFIAFLLSPKGRDIFRRHHYFVTPEEAWAYIGAVKPMGGIYQVPPSWSP